MTESYFNPKVIQDITFNRKILTAFLVLIVSILVLYRRTRKKYKLPPGPSGIPILGYLPFLGPEPYKDFDRLKNIYGNVFSIYMGRTQVIILGDFEAVKDALGKPTTMDRPDGLFDTLPDAVGLASVNGEEWAEQRKFCVKSMREHGIGRNKWESMIQMEVEDFITVVSAYKGQPFDISKIVTSSVSNNISAFAFGKRLPFDHPDKVFLDDALEKIMFSFSQSSITRFFPIAWDIAVAIGIGSIAETHKAMVGFNSFFRKEVERIKETYKKGEDTNFIVDYLKEMENREGIEGHYFNDANLLGNVQALFLAGSDTTRYSICWLILAMANYPDVQSKVQQEIDSVLDKDEKIQWSDRKKVPYTYATIMEMQRWKTLSPLTAARKAIEDFRVQNFDIPKGTTIITNIWSVHNDPKYWNEPEKFDPKRFLTEDGREVIMNRESYVPFSYGKRGCPGDVIAMIEILMYFTALMQNFRITVPKGKKVDMEGTFGLIYQSHAQLLHFTPREKIAT